MANNNIFEFTSAVRGFHHYRKYWKVELEQKLNCYHERNNPFVRFAIKCCVIGKEELVGHLSKEISRATIFFGGASVIIQLTSDHYRRSPLVQGGIEIPCKVTATIPGTVSNLLCMERYKELVKHLYTESINEEILASFLQLKDNVPFPAPPVPKKKKVIKTVGAQKKDIRGFLVKVSGKDVSKTPSSNSNTNAKDKVITIDRCF